MGGRFAGRWLLALVVIVAFAGVAFYSYNMGVAHGVMQSVRVVEAPAPAPGAATVPVVIYPRPWGFGYGFGFFPFFPFLFILFWFFVARALFWRGGWHRGDRCGYRDRPRTTQL